MPVSMTFWEGPVLRAIGHIERYGREGVSPYASGTSINLLSYSIVLVRYGTVYEYIIKIQKIIKMMADNQLMYGFLWGKLFQNMFWGFKG